MARWTKHLVYGDSEAIDRVEVALRMQDLWPRNVSRGFVKLSGETYHAIWVTPAHGPRLIDGWWEKVMKTAKTCKARYKSSFYGEVFHIIWGMSLGQT